MARGTQGDLARSPQQPAAQKRGVKDPSQGSFAQGWCSTGLWFDSEPGSRTHLCIRCQGVAGLSNFGLAWELLLQIKKRCSLGDTGTSPASPLDPSLAQCNTSSTGCCHGALGVLRPPEIHGCSGKGTSDQGTRIWAQVFHLPV